MFSRERAIGSLPLQEHYTTKRLLTQVCKRRKFMKKDTTMNACANCKYYKKSIFGKEQCTRQQIKTKAVHLCCDYEEKKK